MERKTYTMTQADYDGLIEAINGARNTPLIMLQCGMPQSPQEAANNAWVALGKRLGFDGMSVEPGGSKLSFTAVPLANFGQVVGEEPADEADHFMVCADCGQAIDRRDLMEVFRHEEDGHQARPVA